MLLSIFPFFFNLTTNQKVMYIFLFIFVVVALFALLSFLFSKEKFIGTSMWYGYQFKDAKKTSKKDRTESLIKIKNGWLPGKERPLLEDFENIDEKYNPRHYEIQPDYHRTIKQFGVDPNPVESLETPEFMIPKTYRTDDKFEKLTEVDDNSNDAMKIRSIESTFKNVEKNKYYADLLKSKCRAGNRSDSNKCGCSKPTFGEY